MHFHQSVFVDELLLLIFWYLSDSKFLQYIGNMKHDSTVPNTYVVIVINHTSLWDAMLT